jgi:hypothetical protein
MLSLASRGRQLRQSTAGNNRASGQRGPGSRTGKSNQPRTRAIARHTCDSSTSFIQMTIPAPRCARSCSALTLPPLPSAPAGRCEDTEPLAPAVVAGLLTEPQALTAGLLNRGRHAASNRAAMTFWEPSVRRFGRGVRRPRRTGPLPRRNHWATSSLDVNGENRTIISRFPASGRHSQHESRRVITLTMRRLPRIISGVETGTARVVFAARYFVAELVRVL